MRVLVFGDSITQGFWAVEHGWVDRLRRYFDSMQVKDLRHNDYPTVFNLGISADSSEDVLARIKNEITARRREHHVTKPIAIIQIGVNDSSIDHGNRRVELNQYKRNLREVVEVIKDLISQVIFVGFSACDESQTKPVFWGDYIYDNGSIKDYERAMQEVAAENKIPFIPVFDAFAKQLDEGNDLLSDGLHPNDEGHKMIYEIVKPKLEELLK